MEKDYRSLEQKIKNIIIEAANFRNTNARAKIVNVARPDDADPTSEKSKLAKQGEIKTKIIDEAEEKKTDDEKPKDKKESKAGSSKAETEFTGGKTEVDTEPKTDDKIDDESAEKSKGDKAAAKANKEIGKKPNPVKEESSMFGTPKNFGLSASLIAAVSEATKMRKENDANLAKVNDIASNLKGMATTQPGKLPNTDAGGPDMFKSNAPSIVKKEALHPNQRKLDVAPPKGKLTGADFVKLRKEEVELDEATKPAPLSDKETTAVKNHLIKKYGKGKVSFNTEHGAHFVSHDDGYEENHHMISREGGKLTVSHHMTVSNEETNLDELSKGTLGSYIKKSSNDASKNTGAAAAFQGAGDSARANKHIDLATKRRTGINTAVNKLTKEEVEELEELSKGTLGSYVKKANISAMDNAKKSGDYNNPDQPKHFSKAMDRMRGVKKAVDKLTKEEVEQISELDRQAGSIINRYIDKTNPDYKSPKEIVKRKEGRALALKKKWGDKNFGLPEPKVKAVTREEVEELDELSKATVGSYVKKSAQDLKNLEAGREKGESLPAHIRRNRMQNNRTVGTIRGVDKLTGAAKVPANEEVQFSEEEIARITEIAKGL